MSGGIEADDHRPPFRRGARAVDVIVVGGGHAGCEAALAAARLGCETLLVTGAIERIAAMSCNPAIGGVGKGHLVKELDALGGEMGRVADETGIHFRTLNESRGPAVRATRCQSDMDRYQRAMSRVVAQTPRLRLRQDDVTGLVVEGGRAVGVVTRHGEVLEAKAVVLTTGTFLGGVLHRGSQTVAGGRAGEAPAAGLSASIAAAGLRLGRLKTGTCPRLDVRTIDVERLEEQRPDVPAPRFSVDSPRTPPLPQVICRLTRTSSATHDVIRAAVAQGASPLFNGQIGGRGPRYCPSIEDKVVRFGDKDSHLIFLEPHGLDTYEVYPNGLSTSLPPEVQLAFLRTIAGLEDVEVTRWGYAVEYDFVDPTQLHSSLQTRAVAGLYCAGQLNGTTGYEEAAIQGLLAGVNAARALQQQAPVVLRRDQAYAGVLVDDLVLKGTDEPYRMFTSRAEHRLVLREDNVAARLLDVSDAIGLASPERRARLRDFEARVHTARTRAQGVKVPANDATNAVLAGAGSPPIAEPAALSQLLMRPTLDATHWRALLSLSQGGGSDLDGAGLDDDVAARVLTELRYQPFIERAQDEAARQSSLESLELPPSLWLERVSGLSNEVHEKLRAAQPRTLGQASRIAGVTPAALGLLAALAAKDARRASA